MALPRRVDCAVDLLPADAGKGEPKASVGQTEAAASEEDLGKVKARGPFQAQDESQLSFEEGDVITILEKDESG